MLTSKQKVLRRFWYAVMPLEDLATGPKPFRLLGEDIVLFLAAAETRSVEGSLLPSHLETVQGLVQGRTSCLRLSRLDL